MISIEIYPDTLHPRAIRQAVDILQNDGVIIYPTDTIYGLGARLSSKKGVERIYNLKKNLDNKLLSFICEDIKRVSQFALIDTNAYRILKKCLPGPFTFILPASKNVPRLMFKKRRTVGIRVPENELCNLLVRELDEPIISTSVPFGENGFMIDPKELLLEFRNKIDLIIDSGPMARRPSTIVDQTDGSPRILREGAGDISLLE